MLGQNDPPHLRRPFNVMIQSEGDQLQIRVQIYKFGIRGMLIGATGHKKKQAPNSQYCPLFYHTALFSTI